MRNNIISATNRIGAALKWLKSVDLGKLSKFQISRVMSAIRELEDALDASAKYKR
jgi:hypothetical protein